jgi:hypothetical protein
MERSPYCNQHNEIKHILITQSDPIHLLTSSEVGNISGDMGTFSLSLTPPDNDVDKFTRSIAPSIQIQSFLV